jgi:hypothetical protein
VTGLSTVDMGTHWSPFGHVLVYIGVNVGALGVLTLAVCPSLTGPPWARSGLVSPAAMSLARRPSRLEMTRPRMDAARDGRAVDPRHRGGARDPAVPVAAAERDRPDQRAVGVGAQRIGVAGGDELGAQAQPLGDDEAEDGCQGQHAERADVDAGQTVRLGEVGQLLATVALSTLVIEAGLAILLYPSLLLSGIDPRKTPAMSSVSTT